jgi:syndecan 1
VPSTDRPVQRLVADQQTDVSSPGGSSTGVWRAGVSPLPRVVIGTARPAIPPPTPVATARPGTLGAAPVPVGHDAAAVRTGPKVGSLPAIQRAPSEATAQPVPRQVTWQSDATTRLPYQSVHRPTTGRPAPTAGTSNRAGTTAASIQRRSDPPGVPVTFTAEPATVDDGRSTADEPPPDLDDLARRLIEPVARLLRTELRRGRERAGRPHDSRR